MTINKEYKQLFLKNYEEYVGLFIGYDILTDGFLLLFDNNEYIIIPANHIKNQILDEMKNKKIGILNFNGKYLFRSIKKNNNYEKKREEILDFLQKLVLLGV